MTTATITIDDRLRDLFRRFNPFMLLLWRLGLGSWVNAWPSVGGRILVLTHTGHKSGRLRRTPLNYALVDGEVYITAGFGARCDWYRNLQACPQVQVWLPDGWWHAVAEDVTDPARRLPLLRQVLIGSGIVAPAFGLNPHTVDDSALAAATEPYCLIHLRRTAACTGPGGPGDLAWVWPVVTLLLLARLLRQRRLQRSTSMPRGCQYAREPACRLQAGSLTMCQSPRLSRRLVVSGKRSLHPFERAGGAPFAPSLASASRVSIISRSFSRLRRRTAMLARYNTGRPIRKA